MSLLPNKSDFNLATGGLSPKGWIKLLILLTLGFLVAGLIVLFYQDFSNTAEDYYSAEVNANKSAYYVDSKAKFRKEYEVRLEEKIKGNNGSDNSSSGGKSYDSSNIMWGGKPLDFFILELAGEWGTGHFGQKWTDGVPDDYQVPWCANVGWNKTPKDVTTGDGGMGPPQATYTVRGWLQQLLACDPEFWQPIKQWADDPAIEDSSGKIVGYIEPLNKTLMELAKKDYHQYMDDSFQAWFDHKDGGRPIIETVRAEVRKNGVELDDLPMYCQAAIWAVAIRISPYNIGNMFSSTDPDTIVQQVSAYCYAKRSEARWKEMPDVAFALRDGKIISFTGEGLKGVWQHHGDPGIWWFYENWAKGNDASSSSNRGDNQSVGSNTSISTGDFLNFKQGSGSPWAGNLLLKGTSDTIASHGCAVTSIAIMLNDMGLTTDNPGQVNEKLKGHCAQGSCVIMGNIGQDYPGCGGYVSKDGRWDLRDSSKLAEVANLISGYKNAGKYVILQVDYKKSEAGDHFVYCTGVENGKIKIADPAGNYYTWPDDYSGKDRCVLVSIRTFEKR